VLSTFFHTWNSIKYSPKGSLKLGVLSSSFDKIRQNHESVQIIFFKDLVLKYKP